MPMTNSLSTTSEVIDALGGSGPVSEMCGVGRAAVSFWRVSNRFPAHMFPTIQGELTAIGKTADAELFNFERKKRQTENAA